MNIWDDLESRGLIHQATEGTKEWLLSQLHQNKTVPVYCGFDPTADSLHVGSLLPILTMKKLAEAGLFPIFLIGGATAQIGDPSGKTTERTLLDPQTIDENFLKIKSQIKRLMGRIEIQIVDNRSWFGNTPLIDFLRDTGKHFSVNAMLHLESVKNRIERHEQGISFTEFAYSTLQAHDFYILFSVEGCQLQIGGSDQWGNITAGIELIRKKSASGAYGFTIPLLTTTNGTKFGKTAEGTIWLDPKKTHPYFFYKYFLNLDDPDAEFLFKKVHPFNPNAWDYDSDRVQKELALLITSIVHGDNIANGCHGLEIAMHEQDEERTEKFANFLNLLDDSTVSSPIATVSKSIFEGGLSVMDIGVDSGLFKSKGDVRRETEQLNSGFWINEMQINSPTTTLHPAWAKDKRFVFIRRGKQNKRVWRLV